MVLHGCYFIARCQFPYQSTRASTTTTNTTNSNNSMPHAMQAITMVIIFHLKYILHNKYYVPSFAKKKQTNKQMNIRAVPLIDSQFKNHCHTQAVRYTLESCYCLYQNTERKTNTRTETTKDIYCDFD